jgi:hypothetical protein
VPGVEERWAELIPRSVTPHHPQLHARSFVVYGKSTMPIAQAFVDKFTLRNDVAHAESIRERP